MAGLGQLSPGSKCDRYEIVRLIGAGGMGEVYQALHEFTKKPVALKVLKLSHAAKENLVEKMRAEAMVLCRIRHDNLVEVYDAGIAEVLAGDTGKMVPIIWMAMELLDGEALRERLMREGALRPELVLDWAAQVADGLAEAHEMQVVHRDLKPENIFITKKGDVRVLDFGTAKFEGMGMPKTKHHERMGTVPYMSPEHLSGDDVDARSDVYSLGLIIYEMLAGRHPFANSDGSFPALQQLIPMMLAGDPASLAAHVGEPIWQIVHRAIQSNRGYRYGSMRELAQALRSVRTQITGSERSGPVRLSGSSSGAYPPTAPLPTPATPAAGISINATPPPYAASGAHAAQQSGHTATAIAAMAIGGAVFFGGLVVVVALASRGGSGSAATSDETRAEEPSSPKETPKEAPEEAPKPLEAPEPSAVPAEPSAPAPSATPQVRPRPASVPRPVPAPSPPPVPAASPKPGGSEPF